MEYFLTLDNHKYYAFTANEDRIKFVTPDDVRVRADVNKYFGQAIISLDMTFWSHKEVKSWSHFDTWWDGFKLSYFPAWLLKVFPAKMRKWTIKEVVPSLPESMKPALACDTDIRLEPQISFDWLEEIE